MVAKIVKPVAPLVARIKRKLALEAPHV